MLYISFLCLYTFRKSENFCCILSPDFILVSLKRSLVFSIYLRYLDNDRVYSFSMFPPPLCAHVRFRAYLLIGFASVGLLSFIRYRQIAHWSLSHIHSLCFFSSDSFSRIFHAFAQSVIACPLGWGVRISCSSAFRFVSSSSRGRLIPLIGHIFLIFPEEVVYLS